MLGIYARVEAVWLRYEWHQYEVGGEGYIGVVPKDRADSAGADKTWTSYSSKEKLLKSI